MERIWRWNTEVKKLKWKFISARICSQKLPWGLNCRVHLQCRRRGFDPWVRKSLWRRKWQPTPVFLPGKSHGQRSLAGYSSWDHKRVRHDLATKKPNNKQRSQRERQADRSAGLPWVSLASWLCCCCSVWSETLWDLLDCSTPGSCLPLSPGYEGHTNEEAEYSLGKEEFGGYIPWFSSQLQLPKGGRDFCPCLA